MCILVVLIGVDREYPIVIASNRDEHRERRASPPGLWVGERRRVLSPRDRLAGGTWLAVNDVGLLAGLTNLEGSAVPPPDAPSRGHLPHLALDEFDVAAAADAVSGEVARAPYAGFQLVLTDGSAGVFLRWRGGVLTRTPLERGPLVLSNEHGPGELDLPDLPAALEPELEIDERLERLAAVLLDDGARSGHCVLKRGGEYGTVSSSLVAVRPGDPRALIWRYAPGQPDETEYRNYGNLARRLVR